MPFVRLKPHEPCPVCKHKGWCMVGDGAILCARVMSDRRVGRKGAGWLHRIGNAPTTSKVEFRPTPHKAKPADIDWIKLTRDCVAALPDQCPLATELGVSEESVGLLQLGWSVRHGAYTFPMRDGNDRIIGIRTRYANGEKRAILGSRNGLFIPRISPQSTIWVCEGPTDCAALLTIGVFAIGRPSNTGGLDDILVFAKRFRGSRDIAIFADRDHKSAAESLTMQGVRDLAAGLMKIGRRVRVVRPPIRIKDVREWLKNGLNAAMLGSILADANYFKLSS